MGLRLKEILAIATNRFQMEGCLDPKLDAELLMMYLLRVERSYFFTHIAQELSDDLCEEYFVLIDRRASGVPIQYITGDQEFMGLRFFVNESVLIPRQDTELLAETALSELKAMKKPFGGFEVLDLCTGSGAIAVSLSYHMPKLKVTASDISKAALNVAKKNAQAYQIKDITFVEGDLWEPFPVNVKKQVGKKQFNLIAANPPYIPSSVIPTLQREVKDHEPRIALDGGETGLDFYRRILEKASWFLKPQGVMLLEIGCEQGVEVCGLSQSCGFTAEILQDLTGRDRVVRLRKKEEKGADRAAE